MTMQRVPDIMYPASFPNFSNYATIDAAEEHVAFVLPAPKTGTIKKIGWRITAVSSPVDFLVRVCVEMVADAVGVPVSTTYAGKTLFAAGSESAELTITSAAERFDAINGTTGVSVTKGDLLAITIRCISLTGGYIRVTGDQYNSVGYFFSQRLSAPGNSYTYIYTGTGAVWYTPVITIEYDGEFVVTPFSMPVAAANSTITYNSGSNPDRRGLKFKMPYGFTLRGALLYGDFDGDFQVILYDSNEYTVMSGFPINIDKDKRRDAGNNGLYIEFSTEPVGVADTWYRIVVLPTSGTNLSIYTCTPSDDGALLGMTAYPEGLNVAYTTRNGAPSSGDHAWTDAATAKPSIAVVINQIDIPAGGGGGGSWGF